MQVSIAMVNSLYPSGLLVIPWGQPQQQRSRVVLWVADKMCATTLPKPLHL